MTVGHFATGQAKQGNYGVQGHFASGQARPSWKRFLSPNFASRPTVFAIGHFGLRDQ